MLALHHLLEILLLPPTPTSFGVFLITAVAPAAVAGATNTHFPPLLRQDYYHGQEGSEGGSCRGGGEAGGFPAGMAGATNMVLPLCFPTPKFQNKVRVAFEHP